MLQCAMTRCFGCSLLRRVHPTLATASFSSQFQTQRNRTQSDRSRKPLHWTVYKKFQQLLLKPIFPTELYRYPSLVTQEHKKTSKLPKYLLGEFYERQNHLQKMPFADFLVALKLLPAHRQATHLVNEFDEESVRRLKKGEIPLEETVMIADIFVTAQHFLAIYNKLLPKVLHQHWHDVNWTVTDVLHILLFMSMNRVDHRPLMGQIDAFLCERMSELTGNQAAFVCNVFYLAEYSLHTSTMHSIAQRVLSDLQSGVLDIHALNGFLKALSTKRFLDLDFMDNLADILLTDFYLSRLDQQLCMRIISFWANKGISHPLLFETLLSIHKPKNYQRNKDLERLLTHCLHLRHTLPDSYIQEMLNRVQSNQFYRDNPGRLTDVLLSFVMAKVYPSDLIELALSPFFHSEMKQKLVAAKDLHPARGRLLFIDQVVSIESPSSSRFRLPEKVYEKFKSTRGESSIAYFNFRRRSALKPLYYLLRNFCGGVKFVKCDIVLPFSKCPDIEIHTDLEHNLLPHNVNLDEPQKPAENIRMKMFILPDHIKPSVNNQHFLPTTDIQQRKILIRVMMWNQYILNTGQVNGREACELRLLNKLGYEVLLISPVASLEIFHMTHKEQKKYVIEKILQPLKI